MSDTRLPRSAARVVDDAVRRAFDGSAALSRAELGERTGLSRAALQNAVGRMLDEGALTVADRPDPQGSGRPAQRFRLATRARATAMVELRPDGSTSVAMVDAESGDGAGRAAASWREDFPTWSAAVAEAVGAAADEVAAPDTDGEGAAAVVMSVPFPFAPGRGVPLHPPVAPLPGRSAARPPVPDWLRSDPTDALAAVLGLPVRIVNDVNLAGLAEVHRGAARGARTAISIAVRDGFGGALVVDGRVTTGAGGMTGELAHVQAVPDGPLCSCGNRGCIATQTLSPDLVQALTARYGHEVTFADLESLVAHDDPVAVRFLVDLGRLAGGPLAAIVGFLDPDVVVVDGALGGAGAPVRRGIVEVLHQRCSPAVTASTVIVAGHLARPGPIGAGIVGEALAAGRAADVLRTTATPPPPVGAEEASREVNPA